MLIKVMQSRLSSPIGLVVLLMFVGLVSATTGSAEIRQLAMSGEHARYAPAVSPRPAWPPRTVSGEFQVTATNPPGTNPSPDVLATNPPGTGIAILEAAGANFEGFKPATTPGGRNFLRPAAVVGTVLSAAPTIMTSMGGAVNFQRNGPGTTPFGFNPAGTGLETVMVLNPPARLGPANKLTAHRLVDVNTGMPQPSLMIPFGAIHNFNRGTSVRGMGIGLFGPAILNEITTQHHLLWPVKHPALTQTGATGSPLTSTISAGRNLQLTTMGIATFQTRGAPITTGTPLPTTLTPTPDGLVPVSFLWCPGVGFACLDKGDPQNERQAGVQYFPRQGFGRFGGTGGQLRLRPRHFGPDDQGGRIITRAGAQARGFVPQNPAFSTVVISKPITPANPANPRPQNVGLPLGFYQSSMAPAGIFFSANTIGPPLNLVASLAPSPYKVATTMGGTTTAIGTPLDGRRWGGPLTTGTIVVSVVANAAGQQSTAYSTGSDNRTTMGEGSLTLVGGAITCCVNGDNNNWERVKLTFTPEPAQMLGAGAALLALMGGHWISRRRRGGE